MKKNKYDSIFDDITDLEFEEMLKECGFEYEKVKPGKGGLFINGSKVDKDEFCLNEFSKVYYKNNDYFTEEFTEELNYDFDVCDDSFWRAA